MVRVQPLGHDLADGHARAETAVRVLEHDLKIAAQGPDLPSRMAEMCWPSKVISPWQA
jgi:hypothetical protein